MLGDKDTHRRLSKGCIRVTVHGAVELIDEIPNLGTLPIAVVGGPKHSLYTN